MRRSIVVLLMLAMTAVMLPNLPHNLPKHLEQTISAEEKSYLVNSGTGFFISPDGYIVTAAHVILPRGQVYIREGTKLYPLKVIAVDTTADIAILKAQFRPSSYLTLTTDLTKRGTISINGYPDPERFGDNLKVNYGTKRDISGPRNEFPIYGKVCSGNSGGPVLNERNEVLGVVVLRSGNPRHTIDEECSAVTYISTSENVIRLARNAGIQLYLSDSSGSRVTPQNTKLIVNFIGM